MADPAIQTFCCFKPGKRTSPALYAMMEFNSTPYNIVCLISSFIGILGATYQILPKNDLKRKHRWVSLVCVRGRKIIIWLAFADLLAAVGVFVRSLVNLNDIILNVMWSDNLHTVLCTFFAAWIQYWYCSTWMWTLCYTIDVGLAMQDKPGHHLLYHAFCWISPAILTGVSLFYLYFPDSVCLVLSSNESANLIRILPSYLSTYLPMITVMLLNPVLYCFTVQYVRNMVYIGLGQYTNKEREIVDSTRVTFALINIVFYVCWLPNIFSTMIVWTTWNDLPYKIMLILWYTMAILNPLQALFNCLVYNHFSRKMNVPWALIQPIPVAPESTPLLSTSRHTVHQDDPEHIDDQPQRHRYLSLASSSS